MALADAGALILLGLAVAARHQRGQAFARALTLAVVGAGLVALVYALVGSRYLAFGQTTSSLPPYLDLPVLALSLALGIVVFFVARAGRTG